MTHIYNAQVWRQTLIKVLHSWRWKSNVLISRFFAFDVFLNWFVSIRDTVTTLNQFFEIKCFSLDLLVNNGIFGFFIRFLQMSHTHDGINGRPKKGAQKQQGMIFSRPVASFIIFKFKDTVNILRAEFEYFGYWPRHRHNEVKNIFAYGA